MLEEHGVAGSSPALAQGALGGSVGRARKNIEKTVLFIGI